VGYLLTLEEFPAWPRKKSLEHLELVMPKDQPATPSPPEEVPQPKKKPACKACCACPETKRARDDCIVRNGEENCQGLIEAHKQCMRDMGFNI